MIYNSPLNQRETEVLTTIIESYIASASPVGSRLVAEHPRLGISPASIRNTMAELTERGYLSQPHTSAGRVPTAKAFKLYVDAILKIVPLSGQAQSDMAEVLYSRDVESLEITAILRRASDLLAERCHQVSMVLAPEHMDRRWQRIDFVPAARNLVLAVLVLEGSQVETRLVPTDHAFNADELIKFGNYLNTHFQGLPLARARQDILQEMLGAGDHLERMCVQALSLANSAMDMLASERRLFVNGALNILDKAEFADVGQIRNMFSLLEERSRLLSLLDGTLHSADVKVTFHQEETEAGPMDYSMVSASYGDEGPRGAVSIIGPHRMNYAQVVGMVDYIAKTLTCILKTRLSED